jgi:hypothetical protein
MKVGDLVKHENLVALGIVLKTPKQTNNGDCLVQFIQTINTITLNCAPYKLEVISANR